MTCKEILFNFIKQNEGWHKKVYLYSVAEDFSPETVGRKLRELEEEGKIEVGFYNGKYTKGLAMYRIKQPPIKTIYFIKELNKEIIQYEK